MLFSAYVFQRQGEVRHAECLSDNAIRAAYSHAQYLPERRAMMAFWADCLDALRDGKPVPARG
ncbi:MAG: hypothetical protein LBR38_09510 [Synergistaceae bacterium]|jgi:hypothetical protein|nr:hypothetical protein [Synergistaceae bacterium]